MATQPEPTHGHLTTPTMATPSLWPLTRSRPWPSPWLAGHTPWPHGPGRRRPAAGLTDPREPPHRPFKQRQPSVFTSDPTWSTWSEQALARARDTGPLVINPLIYAEVSAGFDKIEDLDDALPGDEFLREPLPYEASFLAGKAFLAYRRRGGQRRSPLSDFHIGAHAAVQGYHLLSRDAVRYRTYFPSPSLITP